MKRFNILIAICIAFLSIIGCKERENKESLDVSVKTKNKQLKQLSQRKRTLSSKKDYYKKRNSIKKDGRILTAEEQLKRYYKEKGIAYSPTSVQRDKHDAVRESNTQIQRSLPHAIAQSQEYPAPYKTIKSSYESEIENITNQPEYSDSEPPELISVRFEPYEAKPGDKVTVVTQAVDNLSGINSIFGVIQNPSGSGTISFHCAILRDDGMFVGYFSIPLHAQSGNWSVKHIKLTDNVHNTKTYDTRSAQLKSSYLKIVNPDSDSTPPTLKGVFLEPTETEGGKKIQIIVDASDEQSGVLRIFGVLSSPSRKAKISFSCKLDSDISSFLGYAIIPIDAESGVWNIDYIRLEDNARNKKTYYKRKFEQLFQSAQVTVHSLNSDSQPPDLQDISVSPPVVAYYENLSILVSAFDDVSGIERVSGRLRSPSGKAYIPFFCTYNSEDDTYFASITIQKNTEVGIWHVENILMVDKAKNRINYVERTTPLIKQATFEVVGE